MTFFDSQFQTVCLCDVCVCVCVCGCVCGVLCHWRQVSPPHPPSSVFINVSCFDQRLAKRKKWIFPYFFGLVYVWREANSSILMWCGLGERVATVMHLICRCSVSGNKCGRLSDSLPSRHVSTGAPFCRLACLRLSSPPHVLSLCGVFHRSYLLSPPQRSYNPSVLSTNHKPYLPPSCPFCQIASHGALSSSVHPAWLLPFFCQLCALSSRIVSVLLWLAHVAGLGQFWAKLAVKSLLMGQSQSSTPPPHPQQERRRVLNREQVNSGPSYPHHPPATLVYF